MSDTEPEPAVRDEIVMPPPAEDHDRTDPDKTVLTQTAPWPKELHRLHATMKYKANWRFMLEVDKNRDQGSRGTTLTIQITTPDSYHPEQMRTVNHYFPVPPAAYDYRSWRRWLFDQILLVERHEAMEFYQVRDDSLLGPDASCEKCAHAMTLHDGRDSSCAAPDCLPHRFSVDSHDAVYVRPYAPSHGPGNDPYMVREIGTAADVRTSYRGVMT